MIMIIFICRGLPSASCSASAISAMTPPSPRLSARVIKVTYLIETTTISAQKKSDRLPKIFASVIGIGWLPAKTSFTAYKGLVPISP
ncbi:MAG: hypothetical protein ACD_10C00440G0002 [uncultured bacterium]|nr:MAG: hypothetical protein ACD_10C00440G0002 [uncultured bacterium]